jgi:3-phenylpropionate/cinnamic acid dioxygenase small subunit
VVLRAWTETSNHHEPFHILYNKLLVTAQNLRNWSNEIVSDAKMKLHMALELILRLDVAQENRSLSPAESDLKAKLKRRVLGLAVIERARTRQASRVTNIKLGDANTKYFHRRVNARRRKNHI